MEEQEKGTVYELSYLLVPTIPEEQLPAKVTTIKDSIANRGGVFISEDYPRYLELSYQMERAIGNRREKFTNAYFGWVKFELESGKIDEVAKFMKENEEVIRFLLIKTVRENTLMSKRPLGRDSIRRREQTEPKVEMNKEEVDAQIDALVEAAVVE